MSKKKDKDPFTRQVHSINNQDDVHYKINQDPEPKKRTRLEIQEANFNNTLRYDRIKGKK